MVVFGIIATLSAKSAVVVFCCTLFFMACLEKFFKLLEAWAVRKEYGILFEKLRTELTQLGIVSFVLFIFDALGTSFPIVYLESFEFTHVTIMFIGIAFMIQAMFLVQYASNANKELVETLREDMTDLIYKYNAFEKESSSWQKFFFYNAGPGLNFFVPKLRTDIELRLLVDVFLVAHKFPPEFDVGNYMSVLFKGFVSSLGHVSKKSWILLAILSVINYIRVEFVDHLATRHVCFKHHTVELSPMHNSTIISHAVIIDGINSHAVGRQLSGDTLHSQQLCIIYFFAYDAFCATLLSISLFVTYSVANFYFDKLIEISLRQHGVSWDEVGRQGYVTCLEKIAAREKAAAAARQAAGLGDLSQKGRSISLTASISSAYLIPSVKIDTISSVSSGNVRSADMVVQQFKEKEIKQAHRKSLKPEAASNQLLQFLKSSKMKKTMHEKEMNAIFLLSKPYYFFTAVKILLFLQCVYLALAFTQFLPIADANGRGGWFFGFVLIAVYNFYLMRALIHKTVQIKAVVDLERDVLVKVCEDTRATQEALKLFRTRLLARLQERSVDKGDWKATIQQIFRQFDTNKNGVLDKREFGMFVYDLAIFMTAPQFNLLWNCLDVDLSNSISWDEIAAVVFPHAAQELRLEEVVGKKLRYGIDKAVSGVGGDSARVAYLRQRFAAFDTDRNSVLDKNEFRRLLDSLGVHISDESLQKFVSSLGTRRGGVRATVGTAVAGEAAGDVVDWDSFCELVFPPHATLMQ